jgi:hypothetical protein
MVDKATMRVAGEEVVQSVLACRECNRFQKGPNSLLLVTEPVLLVTEPVLLVTEPVLLVTEPVLLVTDPVQ